MSTKRKRSTARQINPQRRRLDEPQPYDRIEWMKKHISPLKLVDRTIRLRYLIHPAEMGEHDATKEVFGRFDDNVKNG